MGGFVTKIALPTTGEWGEAPEGIENLHVFPVEVGRLRKRQLLNIGWMSSSAAGHVAILYFHGNFMTIAEMGDFLDALAEELGVAVFCPEYLGYNWTRHLNQDDRLMSSERYCYAGARAAYAHLVSLGYTEIIVWGQSIGSGSACYAAENLDVKALIVQSGLLSAVRVAVNTPFTLPGIDLFPNLRRIRRVSAPTLVMHGEEDEVIAFHHGRQLSELALNLHGTLWLPNAGHNDVEQLYWEELIAEVRTLLVKQ